MEGCFHGEKVVNNLIKSILLSFFIFNLALCSSIEGVNLPNISLSGSYNNPFINTSETLKIEEGMSYSSIIENIGQPLYVKSGNGLSKEVIWVYEVRTILVESSISGEPNKSSNNSKHAGLHHKLQIIFVNGKVDSWGELVEKQKSDNGEPNDDTPKLLDQNLNDSKVNKPSFLSKFSFHTKLGPAFNNKFEENPFSMGATIFFNSIGFQLFLLGDGGKDSGYSFMGVYQKKINNIILEGKLGFSSISYDQTYTESYYSSWNGWVENEYTDRIYKEGISFGMSAGYEFSFWKILLIPMLNINFGDNGYTALTLNVGI